MCNDPHENPTRLSSDVRVLGQRLLVPASPGPNSTRYTHKLGPLDPRAVHTHPIGVVYTYEARSGVQILQTNRFQHSVSRLLDHYPHLSGRIAQRQGSNISDIEVGHQGALFIEAVCSSNLYALGGGDVPARHASEALLPTADDSGQVLSVQHTSYACGSVSLGFLVSHKVCDAAGFFQLVADLAQLYNSGELCAEPHTASYLNGGLGDEETRQARSYQPKYYRLKAPDMPTVEFFADSAYPVTGRFVIFSGSTLCMLKDEASRTAGTWISTFDALSAHLYRAIHRARLKLYSASPPTRHDFFTSINIRHALQLPERYFANGLLLASIAITSDTLVGPLGHTSRLIHDLIRSPAYTSEEEIAMTASWMMAQDDPARVGIDFQPGNGCFIISQWNKFDVYKSARIDGYEPVSVIPPFTADTLVDGLAYLLPPTEAARTDDPKSILVKLALADPLWNLLLEDEDSHIGL